MSPDGKIVFHKVLTSDTSEDGNFIINDLDKNKQYILKLVGKKAERGKIKIRVISKYFKLI